MSYRNVIGPFSCSCPQMGRKKNNKVARGRKRPSWLLLCAFFLDTGFLKFLNGLELSRIINYPQLPFCGQKHAKCSNPTSRNPKAHLISPLGLPRNFPFSGGFPYSILLHILLHEYKFHRLFMETWAIW